MSNQKKAVFVGIIVAVNVGGYLLYSNRSVPEGEEVAAQTSTNEAPPAAEPPSALPVAAAPSEAGNAELAQAAESARLAGIRATEAGRHDEAVARFREAIELGSNDDSVVALLVAAQRARAATQAAPRPQQRARRPQGRQQFRPARRDPEPETASLPAAVEPAPEPVVAAPPEPEPEPVIAPTPQIELPSNEMERNPYVRGGR